MRIVRVECRSFRCLSDVCFTPEPGLNLIRGANAQGKTSLLEAIRFAATTKSHRTVRDEELCRHGDSSLFVRVSALRADRDAVIEAGWSQGAKRFRVNGVAQVRLSDILGKLNVVLFCPEDVELVHGAASARRQFLDMEISQVNPAYLSALQQYRQALRQRNELLKQPQPDPAQLEVWEAQLATHGSVLMQERDRYVQELSGLAASAYNRIAGGEPFSVAYTPDIAEPGQIAAALVRARETDIKRRATERGPHRDDLTLLVSERPARQFSSQGQQKSAALALKLAEIELVRARTGEYPVLMLDEVLAELDENRARRLFAAIPSDVQCLVTTTELEHRPGRFGTRWTNYRIERGILEKV